VPTTAEFQARTLVSASYFDSAADPVEILASGGTAGKNAGELVDDVWDEVISKAAHNVAQSAAKALRQADISITSDTAQGPGTGNNQIQLATGASSVDGAYDPSRVFIKDGTGAGQSRNILQYDGATRTATVDRNWKVNPDATSEYTVMSDAGREHVNEGLAQAGALGSITLNTLASSSDNAYKNQFVFIRSGTGDDQVRRISGYDGTTKIATVSENWDTTPDSTSGYVMIPFACVEVQAIKNQELSAKTGTNLDTFFDASGATTTTEVDDIDTALANQVLLLEDLVDIKGTGFIKDTHSLIDLYTLLIWAQDWLEADSVIDNTNPAQFKIIRTKKQSGGGGATINTKNVNDISGNPIVNLTTVFAEEVEP